MKKILLATTAALAIGTVMASSASATTYNGTRSFDGATVSLSITTDGVIGVVATADILSWNVGITDTAGTADLTPANSQQANFGTDLTATATQLLFNFSGGTGPFIFEETRIGDDGPFYCVNSVGFCWGAGAPAEGASTQFGETPTDFVFQSGIQVLAVSATPLPSTWTMLIAGFLGLGYFAYRGSKKGSAGLAVA